MNLPWTTSKPRWTRLEEPGERIMISDHFIKYFLSFRYGTGVRDH